MQLGEYIKQHRLEKGMSIRALGTEAKSDGAYITRIENGDITSPAPDRLALIARALGLKENDLYTLAGYRMSESLPSMDVYLRTKYQLPDSAIQELDSYFKYVEEKYKHEGESDDDHSS